MIWFSDRNKINEKFLSFYEFDDDLCCRHIFKRSWKICSLYNLMNDIML